MTDIPVTNEEYLQFVWQSSDILQVGRTYAYRGHGMRPDGTYGNIFIPVTITGKAKRGLYGERVTCSDGINRYSHGTQRGKTRVDQHSKNIYYYPNPNFVPEMKPHVQLSLFDF